MLFRSIVDFQRCPKRWAGAGDSLKTRRISESEGQTESERYHTPRDSKGVGRLCSMSQGTQPICSLYLLSKCLVPEAPKWCLFHMIDSRQALLQDDLSI